MRIKWQLALDVLSTEEALKLCDLFYDYVDILEIGTPLIVAEGMRPVREVKKNFPGKTLLADTKIMDGADYMAKMVYEAGADIFTVMAVADDYCHMNHARIAHEYGKLAEADLMYVTNVEERIAQLSDYGIDLFEVHACSEALRPHELKMNYIKRAMASVSAERISLAHSFTFETVEKVIPLKPGIIVFMAPFMNESDTDKIIEMAKKARAMFDEYV